MDMTIDRWAFFGDREAWIVFRAAAFAEAIGWSLLILGVVWRHYGLANSASLITVVGQVHGTLFFGYFAVLMATFRSLKLSWPLLIIAAAISVPPYGTLMFEKWLAHRRRSQAAKAYRQLVVRAVIRDRAKLLMVQPKKGTFWCAPGGAVEALESSQAALTRHITDQLGVQPQLGAILFTQEYTHHGQARLELFYEVKNAHNYRSADLTAVGRQQYDELAFQRPTEVPDLLPASLKTVL